MTRGPTALGLGAVLDLPPGVHAWRSALDVAYVRGAVRRAGRRFGHVAGAGMTDVAAFHDAIGAALELPSYYGRNLDALADCLGDVDDAPVLLWDGWSDLAAAEPRTTDIVLDLLGAARVTTLLRDGPVDLRPRAG